MGSIAGVLVYAIGLVWLLTIKAASTTEYPSMLSNLYAKAAQEKRPLIFLVDNSRNANPMTGKTYDHITKQPIYPVRKQTPSLNQLQGQNLPYLILQNMKKKQVSKPKPNQIKSDFRAQNKPSYKIERFDLNKLFDQDNEYQTLRILIKKNKGVRSHIDGRELRASIVRSVLRQSNGLCDVVEDECDTKQDSCEVKVECEEVRKSDECTFSDTCEGAKEISTKGVLINELRIV